MVTFGPGESAASVSVSIVDDSNIEDTEMFSATLTAVSNVVIGSDDTATITIIDDDREYYLIFIKRWYYCLVPYSKFLCCHSYNPLVTLPIYS